MAQELSDLVHARHHRESRGAARPTTPIPQRTLAFLKDKLNLQFNHQQEVRDQKPDLPTALDPARIAREVFLREAHEAR